MVIHTNVLLRSAHQYDRRGHYAQIEACMYSLRELSQSWVVARASFNTALPITRQLAARADLLPADDLKFLYIVEST